MASHPPSSVSISRTPGASWFAMAALPPFPQPGAGDHGGVARSVKEVAAFLRLPGGAGVPDRPALADPPAAAGSADDELGGLVLVLLQEHVLQHVDAQRPEAVRSVREVLLG